MNFHYHYLQTTNLDTELELPEALHKGHSLDIAHGASQLDNAHLWLYVVFHGLLGHSLHPFLDGIGDMGNNWKGNGR